eukprot:15456151-Alexandrium_andersonii.AAC.1
MDVDAGNSVVGRRWPRMRPQQQQQQQQHTPQRLHPGQWGARVLSAQQYLDAPDLGAPTVVACKATKDCEKVANYWQARGKPADITIVDLADKEGEDKVLVTGNKGPQPTTAKVHFHGDSAPRAVKLPGETKDDEAFPTVPKTDLVMCRLTLAKSFCCPDLFGRASKNPLCLPALLLQGDSKKVVSTKAA